MIENAAANKDDSSKIQVLLVDDSAVVRGALTKILEKETDIAVVGSVTNGEFGVSSAARHKPDIVILDIEMPVMDGLTALPKILEASPQTKVIMFSSLTEKGAAVTLKALSLGAVECLVKPTSQSTDRSVEFETSFLRLVRNLAPREKRYSPAPQTTPATVAAVATKPAPSAKPGAPFTLHDDALSYKGKPKLVAIGSSTGGPQALFQVIKNFKDFDVPIVVTQHMPATFTKILAQHIMQQTGIETHEAEQGMKIERGQVYVAQGGFHMLLKGTPDNVILELDDGPPESFCKPAVDPMFRSAIEIFGDKILGVILTGMGSDGLNGGKMLVEKGGRLIAQDEQTSVVWGMPGAVAQAGICSSVLPLQDIGPWVRKAVIG